MSRLWRDRLDIFLAPDQFIVMLTPRGFRTRQSTRQVIKNEIQQDSVIEEQPWQSVLTQLERWFTEQTGQIRRGTELFITLSNHFVRYGVIAPQPALTNPQELMTYADFRMREIYGERMDERVLSLSSWDPYGGAVCAAISQALQAQLETLAQQRTIRLRQITPYLAMVLDHWAKALDNKNLWFVLLEAQRFCLVVIQQGVWRCVRNQRIVIDLQEELLAALIQESIVLGAEPSTMPIYVFGSEQGRIFPEASTGWRFMSLPDIRRSVPLHFPLTGEVRMQQRA